MGKYQKIQGTGIHVHRKPDGTKVIVEDGDVVETDRDLCARYPSKFVNLEQKPEDTGNVVSDNDSSNGGKKADSDVTASFEFAADLGLTVTKEGRQFVVRKGEEKLTDKPTNKGGVVALIEELMEASSE